MAQARRWRAASAWRQRAAGAPAPLAVPARSFTARMREARRVEPLLAYPDDLDAPLGDLELGAVLCERDGLPGLVAALDGALGSDPMRVCYLGGSVTEQRAGYRPRVTQWLRSAGAARGRSVSVEEVPAFCGNCGSKVLAFMASDWVVSRHPHLLLIELAINDGDTLLETDDDDGIGSALEGIVRHVREALPACEMCALTMFIRDDLPLHLRTGSKAWADNDTDGVASTYHARVPALHARVCARYGVPSVSLVPVMARMPQPLRQQIFRDDCHLLEPGAAFVAAAVCAALEAVLAAGPRVAPRGAARCAPLPPPVHARPWGRCRAEEVTARQLSFFYAAQAPCDAVAIDAARARILTRHTQLDMNPLRNGEQKPWWLLYPGDSATLSFRGTRLAFLTMIGPDAGVVSCEIDGGRWRSRRTLLDRWAYFWRLAVVSLFDDLPDKDHVAVLRLEAERPDASVLRKRPTGPHWARFRAEGKEHKLWLMHWLIEEQSWERAIVPIRKDKERKTGRGESARAPAPGPARRLGGAAVSRGGRHAD